MSALNPANPLLRWVKFNLVGAVGMGVQLGLLALLNRSFPGHYMLASVAALEVTLLHNFVFHLNYTWRDRLCGPTRLVQLLRFHLSNGLVSMAGNLLLMRVLVHEARLPVLAGNAVAILCCSVLNFRLGDAWAFAGRPAASRFGAPPLNSTAPQAAVAKAASRSIATTVMSSDCPNRLAASAISAAGSVDMALARSNPNSSPFSF